MALHLARERRIEGVPLRRRHGLTAFRAGAVASASMDVDCHAGTRIHHAVTGNGKLLVLGCRTKGRIAAPGSSDSVITLAVAMDTRDQGRDARAECARVSVGIPGREVSGRDDEKRVVVNTPVVLPGLAHRVAVVATDADQN